MTDQLENESAIARERVDHLGTPALEIKRLRRCIDDLTGVLALPAACRGCEPAEVLSTLVDSLMAMLTLDFVFARVMAETGEKPHEMLRGDPRYSADRIMQFLGDWLHDDPIDRISPILRNIGDREISIFPIRVGMVGEIGFVVAGSQRLGFPEQTERLVLEVAANQLALAIGIEQARRQDKQKRVASEVDRRVAEQTRKLVETNEELQLQAGLLQHLPVSAWTLKPDGTPDFVNQIWLEYSGQTLDFVRSGPEAWMTAVHPEDREAASRAFWKGIRSGQGFAFETRSFSTQDGTYRWHLQQAVVLRNAEGKVLKFVGTTTDIDDQKRGEEALRESEQSFRLILDGIAGLVAIMSSTGEVEVLNRQGFEYFGKTMEQLKGWSTGETVHPDDLPGVYAAWMRSVQAVSIYDVDHRLRRADGVYRWFHARGLPLCDSEGHVLRWYVLLTDIHDRKQAEKILQENERSLSLIIDTIPTLVWAACPDGTADFFSQHYQDYTGLSVSQAQGWGWTSAIHPDDLPGLIDYWRSVMATGHVAEIEARLRRHDGLYRWFLFRAQAMRDESGKIVKWYGISTDIDDRRRAEDQVRRSEAYFEEAQHLTRIGSFAWQVDSNQITWSEQLYRIYGFTPGLPLTIDLIGTRMHPDDLAVMNGVAEKARQGVSDFEYEFRLLMPDRTVRHLHSIAHATRDPKGRLEYIGAVQDVTAGHLAREALDKARSELAHVSRVTSLGAFTASIAHEVNQPLSGIVTNAGTCLRMLNADPPNLDGARETARRIIRDGNRASDVVTRLRTLYSKKEPSLEPMNLNEAAREVVALLLSELQRNGAILQLEFADRLPTVQGDRIQLQQVIHNLVRNASDAMRDINDRPRRLLIRTEQIEDEVCTTVQDSGIGFDPATADRLFESFYTTKPEGMGIGLSVSRSIVEAHGGRLWASADEGPGATFAFSIPCGYAT